MKVIGRAMRGLFGLFVDDGKLALTEICVLVLVALLIRFGPLGGTLAPAVLVAGTVGALLVNVIRAGSTRKL